mmetsp:Transcript_89765/g.253134  ORF Transcript_89765/g.253134 Transcript_89765/m.253134 type:complete len:444 (+) Transcript_89765:84-1415(+)
MGSRMLARTSNVVLHKDSLLRDENEKPRTSVSLEGAAIANLTKNLVGAGIFTLPAALLRGSLLPGISIMLLAGVAQGSSFLMLGFLCQKLDAKSYRGVWSAAFGKKSADIVDSCIVVECFFCCVAYDILVADFLQNSLEGLFGWNAVPRSLLIWAPTLAITLPLSHARDLTPLRYTSILGLAIIALVFLYVMQDFMHNFDLAVKNLEAHAMRIDMGIFSTLALSTGAFQAHYNAPKFYRELGCDLGAHLRVTARSFGTAFVIYSMFAFAGLGLFGDAVLGNVLKNYPSKGNTMILAVQLVMAISVIATYPLIFTTGRDSLTGLLPSLQRAAKQRPVTMHVTLTSGLVMLIAFTACVVEDVSLVTGLLGATVGSCLCWIFPAFVYLKVTRLGEASALRDTQVRLLSKKTTAVKGGAALKIYSVAMVLIGVLSMCVGVGKSVGLL